MKFTTIQEEYIKNKKIKPNDVKSIIEWVDFQPHLPKITDLEALLFLSCNNGSKEQAKNLIDIYYTTRTHCPELFKDRTPEILKEHIELAMYQPLDTPKSHDRTMLLRFMDTDPSKFNLEEQIKIAGMSCDLWILSEGSASGYQFLVDFTGVQMGHLIKIRPVTLKKALFVLQETLPINISYIHVINVLPIADTLLAMGKPFIKSDLLQKIIFHTEGLNTLYKYVPQKCLPKDLGGNGPSFIEMHDEMRDRMKNNAGYFAEEEHNQRVDEKKRRGKQKNSSDIFGIEGSFTQLDID